MNTQRRTILYSKTYKNGVELRITEQYFYGIYRSFLILCDGYDMEFSIKNYRNMRKHLKLALKA